MLMLRYSRSAHIVPEAFFMLVRNLFCLRQIQSNKSGGFHGWYNSAKAESLEISKFSTSGFVENQTFPGTIPNNMFQAKSQE